MFQQNSYWDQQKFDLPDLPMHDLPLVTSVSITIKQLEDWSMRLQAMADEANDIVHGRITARHAGPLDSDLLDLRDEIVHELHRP